MIKIKKRAEIEFSLVKVVIALLILFVLIMMIVGANNINNGFFDWLRDWF